MPDVPGNVTTTATITVGGTVNGTLETFGDHDWYRITLTAGQSVTVFVDGTTLEDSYLRIRDSSGTVIYENDDINSGVNRDSRLSFTAASSGTYYIDVGAWDENYTGNYQVSVSTYTPPPIATTDQIANQLVEGYWGGDDHNFNVTQGGSITVNITGLTAAAQNLATQALALWTDIIGVQFVQVNFGGQITFDDNESGAFSDGSWSGGFISSSHVNVSTQWLADYGTGLNGYSFQTYIHEIGHALGLGHAGNYNGSASFPFDALFQNDSWATSIMSYFSQTENSYFAGQGFTETFIVTPMMADIVAMSTLYGLSTTTRTGNTTYGFNSNAGRAVYDASLNPNVAYTIFDSGGTDTLDYSGFATSQQINLNPETFSNVGAEVGNIAIGRGVIIENAIGGSGNDILIGNPAANILIGEAGNDLLIGSFGNDTLNGGLGDDQVDGGFGADTLYGGEGNDVLVGREDNDLLIGSEGNDLLIGNIGDDQIDGGLGADTLDGGEGNDVLVGRENDDLLLGSGGNDLLIGSDGNDQIDGATGADTLDGGEGNDVLVGREGDDFLMGGAGADYLVGSDGNDRIAGGGGADGLLGGLGSDRFVFEGAAGNDRIEDFQSGADRIDLSAYGITISQVAAATTNGNTILSVDTNGNGVADFTITLIGAGAPVAADYVF